MARETQKEKIERLEDTINKLQEIINNQNKQIDSMIDKADNSFENSVTYKQITKQIEDLELKLKVANESIEHNRDMYNAELKRNTELIKEIEQLKREQYKYETKKKLYKEIETLKKNNEEDLKEAYREVSALELRIASKDREYNNHMKELEKYYTHKLKMNDNDQLEQLQKENAELRKKLNAGRKEKFSVEQQEQIKQLRADNKSMQEIANTLNCSKATIFNYLKKFNNK